MLDLFSVQSDAKYLERALTLAQDILDLFPAAEGMAFRPYGRGVKAAQRHMTKWRTMSSLKMPFAQFSSRLARLPAHRIIHNG